MKSTNDTIKQVGNNFSDLSKRIKYLETQSTPKLVVDSSVTDPQSGINGQIYINKTSGLAKIYINGTWIPFADTANASSGLNYLPEFSVHNYTDSGHSISWTYQEPTEISKYHIYINSINELGNATFVGSASTTSMVIPYTNDKFIYFGIVAQGNDGSFSNIVWSRQYRQEPITPDDFYVQLSNNGLVGHWSDIQAAKYFEIQIADDTVGTNSESIWTGSGVFSTNIKQSEPIIDDQGRLYLSIRSIGYNGSYSGWSLYTTDVTAPPQPTINIEYANGNAIISLSSTDTSHTSIGFSHYVLEDADDASGTNSSQIDTNVTVAKLPYIIQQSGSLKFYRLTPYDVVGNQGTSSAWVIGIPATPGTPIWVSHIYNKDGHYVTWYINVVDTISTYTIYRNTSPTISGATIVDATVPGTYLSYLIPYASGGDYFGIKAVDINSSESSVVWTTSAYDPTPTTPTSFQANMNLTGGFVCSWVGTNDTEVYEVQTAQDGSGTNADTIWIGNALTSPPLRKDVGYTYFRVRAKGWDGSYSSYTSWATDTNGPPQPTINRITETLDTVTIFIDSTDTSHSSIGFTHYIVEYADDASGTGATTLDSAAPYSPTLSYPLPGILKYYRLTPVDIANNNGTSTSWTSSSYYNDGASVKDYFDTYGGLTTSPLDSLYWWQLAGWEDSTGWTSAGSGTAAVSTSNGVEGLQSARLQPIYFGNVVYFYKTVSLDLTQEGRFTDDDYVTISAYIDTNPVYAVGIAFWSKTGTIPVRPYFYGQVTTGSSTGRIFITVKRSDFVSQDVGGVSPDWSDITGIGIFVTSHLTSGLAGDVYLDDLRIVKADPNDASTYNDIGGVWAHSAISGTDDGEWHVYPGNRSGEPSKPFMLGQINESSVWKAAYIANSDIYTGTVQAGFYKRDHGQAGLLFFISDTTPGSWTSYLLTTTSGAISLYRISGGTWTLLDTATNSFVLNSPAWIGVDLREFVSDNGRIKAYFSTVEGKVIHQDNLKISVQDGSPLSPGGKVGVISLNNNLRMFDFTAGSPAHAETADVAKTVDGPVVDGQDGSKRVFLSIIQKNSKPNLQISQDRQSWDDALAPNVSRFYDTTARAKSSGSQNLINWTANANNNAPVSGPNGSGQFTLNEDGWWEAVVTGYVNPTTTATASSMTFWLDSETQAISNWVGSASGGIRFNLKTPPFYASSGALTLVQGYCDVAWNSGDGTANNPVLVSFKYLGQ